MGILNCLLALLICGHTFVIDSAISITEIDLYLIIKVRLKRFVSSRAIIDVFTLKRE